MVYKTEELNLKGNSNPVTRWARFGPYYAMFPIDFAFDVVDKYSKEGDFIIDPFAGRCSSIFAGSVLGRYALGIEINPVGWLYGSVKLDPAPEEDVIARLTEVYSIRKRYHKSIKKLPDFFRYCFCEEVLLFLQAIRENLDWSDNKVDATLMSIILVHLHGKFGEGLSNQMRQTKAMGPVYSINWWTKKGLQAPPEINPYDFILRKINWRYAKGIPDLTDGCVILGDSTIELEKIVSITKKKKIKYSLLLTSPPYWSITNYHADQWLRLWLLGGSDRPISNGGKHQRRFLSKGDYYSLLDNVFSRCSEIMAPKSTIYVRTDAREYTFSVTLEVLKNYFPGHKIFVNKEPVLKKTQTQLYGNRSNGYGEVDIILKK